MDSFNIFLNAGGSLLTVISQKDLIITVATINVAIIHVIINKPRQSHANVSMLQDFIRSRYQSGKRTFFSSVASATNIIVMLIYNWRCNRIIILTWSVVEPQAHSLSLSQCKLHYCLENQNITLYCHKENFLSILHNSLSIISHERKLFETAKFVAQPFLVTRKHLAWRFSSLTISPSRHSNEQLVLPAFDTNR